MWVVSQNRKSVYKITNAWINDANKNGDYSIGVGYGFGSEEEFSDIVGRYKEERANEVFEDLLNNICNVEKFEMPKE